MNVVAIVTELATFIGFGFMGLVGLAALSLAASQYFWHTASDDAKLTGAKMQKEHGVDAGVAAKLSDLLAGSLQDDDDGGRSLRYEPRPLAHFDWSVDEPAPNDVQEIKRVLEAAGLTVHPFPISPDSPLSEEWHWSRRTMGVWRSEPDWFIVDEDDEEEERHYVEPDLSNWEVET